MKSDSPYIPEVQKDKDWHIAAHDRLVGYGNYDVSKASAGLRAFSQYIGEINPLTEHATLTVGTNDLVLPIDFVNHNAIKPLVDRLNGLFVKRGYGFDVVALAPTAISRKEMAKLTMQVDYDLLPLAVKSQQVTGLAFVNKDAPKSQAELEQKKKSYKDFHEIVVQRLLNDFVTRHSFDLKRMLLFQDSNIVGDSHFMLEYVNGEILPTLLKPTEVFYDCGAKDPLLSDAQFYVVARYMSQAEVLSRWTFTKEQVEHIQSSQPYNMRLGARSGDMRFPTSQYDNGVRNILVTEVYWRDVKVSEARWSADKYGGTHYSIEDKYYLGKRRSKSDGSVDIPVQQIRHCTMVCGTICPEDGWGLIDWVPRSYSGNWPLASFPIISLVPSLSNGVQKSLVDMLIPLQGLRDRCFYMIARAMKKDHGVGALYDVTQRPDGYEDTDVMYAFDTIGLLEIQSRQFAGNAGYNQFQRLDLSISPSVSLYLDLARMARDEMLRIAGMNDPMMGDMAVTQGTVGITKQAIGQSNEFHSTTFMLFDAFTKRILEMAASILRRCVVEQPERYRNIIGDDGVKFYQDFSEAQIEDHGVHILVDDKTVGDSNTISQIATYAVQNGFIDPIDGLKILQTRDTKEMELLFGEIYQKAMMAKSEAAAATQQAQQADRQSAIQLKVMEMQEANRQHMMTLQTQMQIAQSRNAATMKEAEMRSSAQITAALARERGASAGANRPYANG